MKHYLFRVFILICLGFCACHKGNDTPAFTGFETPLNFPEPLYHFATNPVTEAGFVLGRTLFYDPVLSANNTISCGSCHIQTAAFTHHGHATSHGIYDRMGTRNSPPVANLAWHNSFMWDGGIADLDLQAIAPITNHVEMDETMDNVLHKLRASPRYPPLFQKAFGSPEISTANFLKALSQFMVMCVSSHSKYDSVMRGQGAVFTADEAGGYTLVQQKCTPCHAEPLFTDHSFRNNGISISGVNDEGRYLVTQQDSDRYKFRVPSLRNLSYTAPFMHDGRFLTVEAVLDHYAGKVQRTPNLDTLLTQGEAAGIALTTGEKQKIIAFLRTLDDKTFLMDKRFAEQ